MQELWTNFLAVQIVLAQTTWLWVLLALADTSLPWISIIMLFIPLLTVYLAEGVRKYAAYRKFNEIKGRYEKLD